MAVALVLVAGRWLRERPRVLIDVRVRRVDADYVGNRQFVEQAHNGVEDRRSDHVLVGVGERRCKADIHGS